MKKLRMSRRLPVSFSAFIKSGTGTLEGVVRQISEGGMLFTCRAELEVDTRMLFSLKVFDDEPDIVIEGELLYRRVEKENDQGQELLYGVKFTDRDSSIREEIARVIRFATVRERYSRSGPVLIEDGEKK
jgi:c-di-GMP-binding flagellar brake protein YcgR